MIKHPVSRIVFGLSLVVMLSTSFAQASESNIIQLSAKDLERHALIFEPVMPVNQQSGQQVSAQVIDSPQSQSNVTALLEGVIDHWLVPIGASVTKGMPIAKITSQAMSEVQQSWSSAKTVYEQAEYELNKDKVLFSNGIISEQRLKQSERFYSQSQFQLKALTEKLSRLGFTQELTQKLQKGEIHSGHYYLKAPTDGVFSQRYYEVGDYVPVNQKVASIKQASLPWVTAQIPLTLANMLQANQPLSFVDKTASKSVKTSAKLVLMQKDLQIVPSTQMVNIKARFIESVALLPGQIISLIIPVSSAQLSSNENIMIPESAVVHTEGETQVFVLINQAEKIDIEVRTLILQPAGQYYIANNNIKVGEKVAVQGASILKGITLGLGKGE